MGSNNEKDAGKSVKQWGLLALGTVLLGGSATTASQWLTQQQIEVAVKSGGVTAVVIGGIVFLWRQVIERQDHIMAVSETTITSQQRQLEELGKRYDDLELRYDELYRQFDRERTGWFREKGELLREMGAVQQQLQTLQQQLQVLQQSALNPPLLPPAVPPQPIPDPGVEPET